MVVPVRASPPTTGAGPRADRASSIWPPFNEGHAVPLPGAVDLHLQPRRQRVHHRHAHAVQASRDLVALAPELSSRVQQGHHQLGGGDLVMERMGIDGNAASVIGHLARTVLVQGHVDAGAIPGHRLIHRVVHHLPHEVVQAGRARRPDVHAGPLPHGLEALENGYLQCAVRPVVT